MINYEVAMRYLIIFNVILTIYIWSFNRKKPMLFLSRKKINSDKITNIRQYNQANGKIFLAYSTVFLIATLAEILELSIIARGIVLIGGLGGFIPLLIAYFWIYKKYQKGGID